MAKLYWRIKRNGKWTWAPAKNVDEATRRALLTKSELEEEE